MQREEGVEKLKKWRKQYSSNSIDKIKETGKAYNFGHLEMEK